MAKDPAVLLYTSDFLTGVTFLTMEERGIYITLLCMQHQQGGISEKDMLFICGSRESRVFVKFYKEVDGLYYNKRMKDETDRRKAYSESRANNRKKKEKSDEHILKTSKPYEQHMENENEDINVNINKDEKEDKPPPEKVLVYPFPSDEFMNMWANWKEYKSKEFKFKYKSIQSEQASLTELSNLSNCNEEMAMMIIKQSMANGWKGLFELKKENNGTTKHGQQSAISKEEGMRRNFELADKVFAHREQGRKNGGGGGGQQFDG